MYIFMSDESDQVMDTLEKLYSEMNCWRLEQSRVKSSGLERNPNELILMCLNAGHEYSSHANNVGIIFLGGHPEYFNQAKSQMLFAEVCSTWILWYLKEDVYVDRVFQNSELGRRVPVRNNVG
ncbi:hypothetical protein DKX38_004252 [Salix brachista]|uniref:Uncharacterized protein n=1 Tax=Salix brachista TaxID=2182728 RepID=A0A5N5NAV1_9ROSI|nr:hypothetical protein DKX38_004252 [Salix brachista]